MCGTANHHNSSAIMTSLPPSRDSRFRSPKRPIVIPERVAKRAATRWSPGPTDCWVSTSAPGSHGYGQIGWTENGHRFGVTAHRAAWVYHSGKQIPTGATIDHTCKNRRCVNPNHLRVLTNFENARRTFGRDWPLGECANGHPNSELHWTGTKWECRLCRQMWRRNYQKRKKQRLCKT